MVLNWIHKFVAQDKKNSSMLVKGIGICTLQCFSLTLLLSQYLKEANTGNPFECQMQKYRFPLCASKIYLQVWSIFYLVFLFIRLHVLCAKHLTFFSSNRSHILEKSIWVLKLYLLVAEKRKIISSKNHMNVVTYYLNGKWREWFLLTYHQNETIVYFFNCWLAILTITGKSGC